MLVGDERKGDRLLRDVAYLCLVPVTLVGDLGVRDLLRFFPQPGWVSMSGNDIGVGLRNNIRRLVTQLRPDLF